MRLSCNGCRVLRKGCSDDCSIKPCLEWIRSPDAQANATVFLAKFYGRAGLINLIDAAPTQLRHAVFKSLLQEACGRMVNPVYGSVGLAWSGSWRLCQEALEAVLRGDPITKLDDADAAESVAGPSRKACDIRHVKKGDRFSVSNDLNRVRNRCRFKRAAAKAKPDAVVQERGNRSPSEGSSVSHRSEMAEKVFGRSESLGSAETATIEMDGVRPPICVELESSSALGLLNDGEIELELSLCLESSKRSAKHRILKPKEAGDSADVGRLELRLD